MKTTAEHTRGDGRVYQRGPHWWCAYYSPKAGRMVLTRERAKRKDGTPARSEEEAWKYVRARRQEVAEHRRGGRPFQGPAAERRLFTDLLSDYQQHAELKRRKSLASIRSRCRRLGEYFDGWRALAVTHAALITYVQKREADGVAPATVNRETEIIARAFAYAAETSDWSYVPTVPTLDENNVRKGFFEAHEFEAVRNALDDDDLRDFIEYLYLTAWRKGEAATLSWADVDLADGVIRLREEHSKTGDPRTVPITGALEALIARRCAARQIASADGTVTLYSLVFHRKGAPIGDFRKVWRRACIKAGLLRMVTEADGTQRKVPTKLVHDFRRTGVRDMVRAGVREGIAMSISGHRTRSTFERYNITDLEDQRQALARTDDYRAKRPREAKVVALPTASNGGAR